MKGNGEGSVGEREGRPIQKEVGKETNHTGCLKKTVQIKVFFLYTPIHNIDEIMSLG